jgi:hypothetical protein
MVSGVYNKFKTELMNKIFDMEADTIYAALLNSAHSFDADNNTWTTVVTNEISGAGYTANGNALAGKDVSQDDTDDEGVWTANNAVWTSASFTAHYCVIRDLTASNFLVACIDFGSNQTVSSGTFTIDWNAEGIINIG